MACVSHARAIKPNLLKRNLDLNMLGYGSHTPHAESAIRHVKNKARSTAHNHSYAMSTRWVSPLFNFVAHAINISNTRVSILCCLLKLLKNPESKMASGWSAEDKMVNATMISLWLTSWSSQRVFLTMTSWSNVKGYIQVVWFKICDKRLD